MQTNLKACRRALRAPPQATQTRFETVLKLIRFNVVPIA
jgi:hypothetical protein